MTIVILLVKQVEIPNLLRFSAVKILSILKLLSRWVLLGAGCSIVGVSQNKLHCAVTLKGHAWLCWSLFSFAERLQYLASVNFKLDCELLTLLTGLMFFQHDIMIINRIWHMSQLHYCYAADCLDQPWHLTLNKPFCLSNTHTHTRMHADTLIL